jgi:adenine phosphoribosyltransferase
MSDLARRVSVSLHDVPDFPKPGIVFKDITPLLADAKLFHEVIGALAQPFHESRISHVIGIESRGFLFAAPVALALGAGVIPVRKPGKLPRLTHRETYALEYGTDSLEMHRDGCPEGSRILVVDDVLATGGTAAATCRLARRMGADVIGCAFLLKIGALNGAETLLESLVAPETESDRTTGPKSDSNSDPRVHVLLTS